MLPSFNTSGVLPPFTGDDPTVRNLTSPYKASMTAFVARFGHTPERRDILRRLLAYRQALRATGIVTGFQLFDGSFVEDCEALRGRPPKDLDVVTFSHLPVPPNEIQTFLQQNIHLFSVEAVKEKYLCDSYFVDLTKDARLIVADTMYWYSLFSHQRDTYMWKGLTQIPLLGDDAEAAALLDSAEAAHA